MRTPHKLAAVLFADIAGYTAMMADNEDLALEKLYIFKEQLNKAILLNSGQLVQYFGDGALCTFESSVKAVECAIQLQNALGKGTLVPVRIGIHTGDVVYKEGNVYGDAVNIASRIESIGQPGTILVSESVRNQLKSIGELEFTSLGKFHFKNIEEPIEVYAFSSQEFLVPSKDKIEGKITHNQSIKKTSNSQRALTLLAFIVLLGLFYQYKGKDIIALWDFQSTIKEIAEEGLIIFDFENNTGDTTYNNLRCRIHSILSKSLIDNKIKVKNHSTLCHNSIYLNVIRSQIGPSNKMEKLLGSKYALEGYLFKENDSLGIQARIFRTSTNEDLLITDPILMSVENIDDGVIKISAEILNFWEVKDDPIFIDNLPNQGWYELYNKAISLVEKDYAQVLELVSECKKIDSNQFRPDFLAMEVYDVYRQPEKIDSIIEILENKSDLLTEAELNLLYYRKALSSFNYRTAYERYLNEYYTDPKNAFLNYAAIGYAVKYVNEPEDAIRFGKEIPYDLLDYSNCKYCMDRIMLLAMAKMEMGQYQEALEMLNYATDRELKEKDFANALLRIRATIRMKDNEGLKEILEESKLKELNHTYLIYWSAREYILVDEMDKAEIFMDKYFNMIESDRTVMNTFNKVELLIGLGIIDGAEEMLNNYFDQEALKDDYRYLVFKGHIEARQGKTEEVNKKLDLLEKESTRDLKRMVAYHQSRITAGYQDPEQSLNFINEALVNGKVFTIWELHFDPLLKKIRDTDRYKNLINNI
ncbi:MAG: adenylate/guanylate cyclase domain-containing protein [Saprospiraceae bacterium]|nr:adenylate/guanylate cyclase domain-containing protein [Saprospiraceae bacterium]